MIKILQITGFIAVIWAAVLTVLPAVFGVRGDQDIEKFLNSPRVIEEFDKTAGKKTREVDSEISPLVKQAQAFALYLNPPPKPQPKTPAAAPKSAEFIPKPEQVSVKFDLIGTSFFALHPELSLALIDEPGKGLRWVRQSAKVGHLIIEQIKDGLVVIRDGERTFELTPKRLPRKSFLKGSLEVVDTLNSLPVTSDKTDEAVQPQDKVSQEEEELVKKMISEIEAMQKDPNSEAAKERLVSNAEAMRISAEESLKLHQLGKGLQEANEPNQPQEQKTRQVVKPKHPQRPRSQPRNKAHTQG